MAARCKTARCAGTRARWEVVCNACFRQLPPALIDCMKRAKRGGNRAELDRLGREAAALVEARPPRTGAQAAYQSIARQLGEGGAA